MLPQVRVRVRVRVRGAWGEVCNGCSHRRGAHAEPAEMMREVVW